MFVRLSNLFRRKPCRHCNSKPVDAESPVIATAACERYTIQIEAGCLVCNACETTAPRIFDVREDSVTFRAGHENFLVADELLVREAIEGCPCAVLKIVPSPR